VTSSIKHTLQPWTIEHQKWPKQTVY
jgi:hypothetical protein